MRSKIGVPRPRISLSSKHELVEKSQKKIDIRGSVVLIIVDVVVTFKIV